MYNNAVDLNELVVFTRVVQAGSFTAAARTLGMPKSSVSKKVSDLEARIGARLLQRTTRRLGLTDAGRVYFARTARIVTEAEDAERAVQQLQAAPRGLLRVSVPLSFGMLGGVVASFLREHPDVELEIVCTDRLVDLVEDGFDVAVRAGVLQDTSLVARSLGSIRRVLVASPAYLRKRGTPRAPEALCEHACIAFGSVAAPSLWSLHDGTAQRDVRVSPRLVVNDFDMMLTAARAGVGIAWALESLAANDLREKTLRRVLPAWRSSETPVHVIYPTSRLLSPKVVAFVEAMRSEFSLNPAAGGARRAGP